MPSVNEIDASIQLAAENSFRQDERDAFIHKLAVIIAIRKVAAHFQAFSEAPAKKS